MTRLNGDPEGGNEGSSGLPGKGRFEKIASSSGTQAGRAYQGAMESVFAIVIGAGAGYWADSHFGSSPRWLVVGAIVGFGAFVLRLARMAKLIEEDTRNQAEPLDDPESDHERDSRRDARPDGKS